LRASLPHSSAERGEADNVCVGPSGRIPIITIPGDIAKRTLPLPAANGHPSLRLWELRGHKAAGHTIEQATEPERRSNVINLMDALQQSIKGKTSVRKTTKTRSQKSKRSAARRRRAN